MESLSTKEWYLKNKKAILQHINQVNNPDIPTEERLEYTQKQNELPKQILKSIVFIIIVAAATALLVATSLEVFGDSWQGWVKALLLELAILALAVSKTKFAFEWQLAIPRGFGAWILNRGTLVFLLVLSFSVLHTGVESQRSDGLNTARSTSATLTDLINERGLWQKTHDDYPENRLTDRRNAMTEISRLNSEIKAEREALPQSLDGSVINLKSNTEMMLRAALLLLNIIFGHKLVRTLATIKWPPIREVGARS